MLHKSSKDDTHDEQETIDQHLAELQLLNSAVVINRSPRMCGTSGFKEDKEEKKVNGHSGAKMEDKAKVNGNSAVAPVDKEHMERKKKGRRGGSDADQLSRVKHSRRGSSDADQLSRVRHSRRPSDIDSLSPEVVRALQSTFGQKLNEIRSRFRQRSPSPPPSPPPPPRVPTPVPTPPPSPPRRPPSPPPVVEYKEERTFVERLADKEGPYMLIAYFSAIFISGFILLATEDDDTDGNNIDGQEELFCPEMGLVASRCERLFGYILPSGLMAVFFILAVVVFVLDVSYSLFNMLTTARDRFYETKKNASTIVSKGDDYARSVRPRPSAARLVLLFLIDLGFIIASSALLWISKTSTVDPLHTICEQRLRLLWMLGLMVIDVVILFSAVKSFRDPRLSNVSIQTAALRVSMILCILLACTAAYQHVAPDSKQLRPCLSRIPAEERFDEIPTCEPLQLCAATEEPELLQCEWQPQIGKEVPHLEMCEPNQQCDWPRVKQVQLYERKDVCPTGLPQCDWPLVKQIQPYEDKDRCEAREFGVQCEWPLVKQIQPYEQEERCRAEDGTLQQCDWPLLKQLQPFEPRDRCPLKNPDECEWPWIKQIQVYQSEDSFSNGTCKWRLQRNYTSGAILVP